MRKNQKGRRSALASPLSSAAGRISSKASFLSQHQACGKYCQCRQQPLNPPDLYSLPVQNGGCRVEETGERRGNNAGTSKKQCYKRAACLTQRIAQRCKIKPRSDSFAGGRCKVCVPVRAAYVAKARSHQEVGAAVLAYLPAGFDLRFSPRRNGWFPEFLPLVVITC